MHDGPGIFTEEEGEGTCIGDFGNKVLNKLVTQNPKWVLGFSRKRRRLRMFLEVIVGVDGRRYKLSLGKKRHTRRPTD